MIDRASVVAAAILHVVRTGGTGAEARVEIVAILRDEFSDVARTTLNEIQIRLRGE
jgi:hypothetical protein